MRQLKFRVWDPAIPEDIKEAEDHKASGDMVNWEYVKKSSYLIDGLNGKYPMMQYTGLKDKNGKKIYEGDILKFKLNTRYGYIEKTGVVKCESLASGCTINFLPLQIDGILFDFSVIKPETIGNIYNNPELTEAKQ